MKANFILGMAALAGLVLIGSCSKDDPPPKTGISFELESLTVTESDGTLTSFHPDYAVFFGQGLVGRSFTIKILLDRPLTETVVLQYSLSGTATNINPPGQIPVNDYSIKEGLNTIVGSDKITIEKGATEASIIVTVYEDFAFEVDDDDNPIETAIFKLVSVVSGHAQLGDNTTFTLNIVEDDAVILLQWFVDGTNSHGDVDMDMFVWLEDELINSSTWDNNDPEAPNPPYEGLFIPAGFPNGTYGMNYTYYSGTSDEVDFIAIMWGTFNGNVYPYFSVASGEFLLREGTYGLENINTYTEEDGVFPPPIVQTIIKNGIGYNNVSEITRPASGSRVSSLPGFRFDRNKKGKFKSLRMVDIPRSLLEK